MSHDYEKDDKDFLQSIWNNVPPGSDTTGGGIPIAVGSSYQASENSLKRLFKKYGIGEHLKFKPEDFEKLYNKIDEIKKRHSTR